MSTPASSARAACSAAAMLPAAAMWFSLIRMPSHSAMRWLWPPPVRTAYFCAWRRPGRVLRVSSTTQPCGLGDTPAIASTYCRVTRRHARQQLQEVQRRPLGAEQRARIAVDAADHRAGGHGGALGHRPFDTGAAASRRRTQASNQGRPQITAASLATTCARTRRPARTSCAVQSPRPMSSISASRTLRAMACSRRLVVIEWSWSAAAALRFDHHFNTRAAARGHPG